MAGRPTHEKTIAIFVVVGLLCLAGCSNQENIDAMNLQHVSGSVSEKGYGETDGKLSGEYACFWKVDDTTSVKFC